MVVDTRPPDRALQQRGDRWRAVDNELTRLTETAMAIVRRLFRAEGKVIGEILLKVGPTGLEGALDTVDEDEWTRVLETLWIANGEIYFVRTINELTPPPPEDSRAAGLLGVTAAGLALTQFPEYLAEVRTAISSRAAAIVVNTQRRITETAQKAALGIAEDLGSAMRGAIRTLYSTWDIGRAGSIARHNVMAATALGQHVAAKASGVQLDKEWISMQDSRVRPSHAAADGQRANLHGFFFVGGEQLDYPRDPAGSVGNTANCRCQQIFIPIAADDPFSTGAGL